jgi:hypothetical protein
MIELSRRGFLQLTALSAALTFPKPLQMRPGESVRIRLLKPVVLRSAPRQHAKYLQLLPPDTVHIGTIYNADWIRLEGGYIPATHIQVMLAASRSDVCCALPGPTWVEVIAPYVALRAYASPEARLLHRANHGDVFCLTHSFVDDAGVWWAQTEYGWLQAAHTRTIPLLTSTERVPHLTITLNPIYQSITVTTATTMIATMPAVIPRDVPDDLKIEAFMPGMQVGRPWNIIMGEEWVLHGEGSHNDFGKNTRPAAPHCVELATITARWLYFLAQSAKDARMYVQW